MKRILLMIAIILAFFTGCNSGILSPKIELPVSQTRNDVERIELLVTKRDYTALENMTIAAVFYGEDAGQLWDALQTIDVEKCAFPPPSHYGRLAIAVYYRNGNFDVLGTALCGHCTQGTVWSDVLSCLNYQDTKELFSLYISDHLLPVYP